MSKVSSKNLRAKKAWKDWDANDIVTKMGVLVPEHRRREVLEYVHEWLDGVKTDAEAQKDMTPEDYIIARFKGAYTNGGMFPEETENNENDGIIDNSGDEDQEIIEVSQDEVKKALKALLMKQSDIIAVLYKKHEDYNKEFFDGKLSVPIMTIDKMSNKTLGAYNHAVDNTGLENHIYFNRNFIALNTETRILETLRHEMIHQYQDEVLYEKTDKDGSLIHEGAKRPKEWHNKDFKEWAELVGIVANGKNCTGNPAKMPEPKSYNRKFACGCVATNGYPVTIWSTREIFAVCQVCGQRYTEIKKSGGTIAVKQSSVEKSGEDIIEIKMKETYNSFDKFESKADLTAKVKELKEAEVEYKEGIYQKGHNAYSEGFHYWVAWQDPVLEVEEKEDEDLKSQVASDIAKGAEVVIANTTPASEAPKKRGRKSGTKNKPKGVESNDKADTNS